MTQLAPPATRAGTPSTDAPSSTWRVAGGIALAHAVLLMGAFAVEGVSVEHGASPAHIQHAYADAPLTRVLGGGYVEALSFIVLVPALVLIARLFSARTDLGQLASRVFLALGVAYVGSTLAVGFPAGAAAMYAAHHGVDAGSIAMVNDIRNYAFVLQVALTAAMALALGVAARAERAFPRWVGWGGIAFGAVGLAVTPFAQNAVSMVWLVWWVGTAVLLLRGGPRTRAS